MINTEKNNKTVKLSNLIEKIWILGVIGFYIYLYVSQNFSNWSVWSFCINSIVSFSKT